MFFKSLTLTKIMNYFRFYFMSLSRLIARRVDCLPVFYPHMLYAGGILCIKNWAERFSIKFSPGIEHLQEQFATAVMLMTQLPLSQPTVALLQLQVQFDAAMSGDGTISDLFRFLSLASSTGVFSQFWQRLIGLQLLQLLLSGRLQVQLSQFRQGVVPPSTLSCLHPCL